LTEEMKAYLRGKRYEKEKERHGAESGVRRGGGWNNKNLVKGQNVPLINSSHINASRLADEYNVEEKTIRRDSDFSVGVDAIALDSPEEATKILAGKSDLTKAQIQEKRGNQFNRKVVSGQNVQLPNSTAVNALRLTYYPPY
jgi:hypothetical protein